MIEGQEKLNWHRLEEITRRKKKQTHGTTEGGQTLKKIDFISGELEGGSKRSGGPRTLGKEE